MDYVYILHDLWEKLRYSLHAVREKPFPIWISEKMQAYMDVCFASVAYTEKIISGCLEYLGFGHWICNI